ncbi:cytochrome P450 [Thamnidium elegans]|nr:cytochrome P450 [Thamnidium elegans]BDB32864.1 cytochrome P450 monooxygenase [Thamnidium elegans]
MDYLNKLSNPNGPIHNAVDLIQKLPITNRLTDMYKRSSKNELYFVGAATFITLYNLTSYIQEKRQKLNLPPTVPFGLPFLGHGLYLLFMPKTFLDWCNNRYGEVYNLKARGKIFTVTNGTCGEESLKADRDDLSLDHGLVRDTLYFHYVFEPRILEVGTEITTRVAKIAVASSTMPRYVSGIQKGLEAAQAYLLKEKVNVLDHPSPFFQRFVSFMSVPTLLGEEFASNIEVIESFASFTGDIIRNIPVFMLVPTFLHRPLLPYIQSPKKHHAIMEKHISPVVRQRREIMRLAKEAGEDHGFEQTFLQGLIEYTDADTNEYKYSDKEVAHGVLMLAFVSAHTTSTNLSYCIYWLLARPDLMERMMAEIESVAPGNTPIDVEVLNKMTFLNNFMREVLRQGASNLGVGKKAMEDFTFSNGYQVPKGRMVESSTRQLNFGTNSIRSEVEEMDPDMSKNRIATTPARDYISFGMGKHLCPGRFFATQEIKMSLIYLLRNFDIKTVNGKKPTPMKRIAGTRITNSEEPLIFTTKN